jgi:hypothetical protein
MELRTGTIHGFPPQDHYIAFQSIFAYNEEQISDWQASRTAVAEKTGRCCPGGYHRPSEEAVAMNLDVTSWIVLSLVAAIVVGLIVMIVRDTVIPKPLPRSPPPPPPVPATICPRCGSEKFREDTPHWPQEGEPSPFLDGTISSYWYTCKYCGFLVGGERELGKAHYMICAWCNQKVEVPSRTYCVAAKSQDTAPSIPSGSAAFESTKMHRTVQWWAVSSRSEAKKEGWDFVFGACSEQHVHALSMALQRNGRFIEVETKTNQ